MTKKISFLLVLITLLAFLLRFYQLGENPPGLNLDEVAIGYNAYSILKTGRDEYGKFLPVVFRSHDDYKPPLYIYLTVPSEAVFGLSEFAVRFPAALLGVLATIALFFLVAELIPKSLATALLAAFLLAISPWHLQFTRVAFETGSTVFFTSLGLLFFIKAQRQKFFFFWLLSAFFFGLELYLYQASKVFVPLLVLSLIFFYFPNLRWQKKKVALFCLLFFLFLLPVIILSATLAGQIRFQGTSIFRDPTWHDQNISWRITDWLRKDRISPIVLHPEFLAYGQIIVGGYLSHFRPDFLFVGASGPPVNYISGVGLLSLWELPFVPLGIYFLWRRQKKAAEILTAWLLLAPLPAAVTTGVPSSIRTTLILPTYQIFTAVGVLGALAFLNERYLSLLAPAKLLFLLTVGYFLVYQTHMMHVHSPKDYSESWSYSYKDVVQTTARLSKNYQKIIVSPTLRQPHNFFAFYLKYDPWTYQNIDGGTVSGGFGETRNHFAKYYFQPIPQDQIAKVHRILFIGLPRDFPDWVVPFRTFYYLNGKVSVIMVGT